MGAYVHDRREARTRWSQRVVTPVMGTGPHATVTMLRRHRMADAAQNKTLRDYLRVLRQQRLVVLVAVSLSVGIAVAYVVLRQPTYEASSSLAFRDPADDLSLLGSSATPQLNPEKAASANAQSVTTADNLKRVKTALKSRQSLASLRSSVNVLVEPVSNLVVIQAKARTGAQAARIANTFARVAVRSATTDSRQQFSLAADALQKREDALQKSAKRRRKTQGSANGSNQKGQTPSQQQTQDSQANLSSDIRNQALYDERISRLQSLALVARPVQISDVAEIPGSPTSPKPARDIGLALFLGLILGGIAAYLRDTLDRRLHSADEIGETVELPVVGHVRDKAMGRSPIAAKWPALPPLEEDDLEGFRILRTNVELLSVDTSPRSVIVTSALPEEGKSTVAASLAWAWATAGRRTLLVECDIRRPVLAERLGLAAQPGLTEHLAGRAELEHIVQRVAFGGTARLRQLEVSEFNGGLPSAAPNTPLGNGADELETTLACITAGAPSLRPADLLGSKRLHALLERVASEYEAVVLDSPPLLSVVDARELIPRVDAIVVCVRASKTTRDQMKAAKTALQRFPGRPTGLVVTGLRAAESTDYGYYSYGSVYAGDPS